MKKVAMFVMVFLLCGGLAIAEQGRYSGGRYVQECIDLPLSGFQIENGGPITASTAPGLEQDDSLPNIVWADGETSAAQHTFYVPQDYKTNGLFRVVATESDSTTPNQIDFDVYINSSGSGADSSATDQTPVAISGTTSTPSEVELIPGTDFDNLAGGQWTTLRLWRDNVAVGTGDLEVKGVVFCYDPK